MNSKLTCVAKRVGSNRKHSGHLLPPRGWGRNKGFPGFWKKQGRNKLFLLSSSKKQGRNEDFDKKRQGRNKDFWPKYLPLTRI